MHKTSGSVGENLIKILDDIPIIVSKLTSSKPKVQAEPRKDRNQTKKASVTIVTSLGEALWSIMGKSAQESKGYRQASKSSDNGQNVASKGSRYAHKDSDKPLGEGPYLAKTKRGPLNINRTTMV